MYTNVSMVGYLLKFYNIKLKHIYLKDNIEIEFIQ